MRFRLEISRVAGRVPPVAGRAEVGVFRGGPEVLLGWLETQLGLGPGREGAAHRIAQYARRIDAAGVVELEESVAADRLETAAALLRRRDALRIGGWDGGAIDGASPLVRAIVAVEEVGRAQQGPSLGCRPGDRSTHGVRREDASGGGGESERLDAILAALDAGQVLPPHCVVLLEPVLRWPRRWRWVLGRLEVEECEPRDGLRAASEEEGDRRAARSTAGGAAEDGRRAACAPGLLRLQGALATGQVLDVEPDGSLAWVNVPNRTSAVELVGTLLLEAERACAETVVACADPLVRLRLEHRLAALRLPTAGVRSATDAAPVFQVLPLAIDVCRRPVDPSRLLDFLQLPIGPLPRAAARRLAGALAEHPGLGSERWAEVWGEVCSDDADPDGTVRAALERWLGVDLGTGRPTKTAGGAPALPAEAVVERCAAVAAWAGEAAAALVAERPHRPPRLAEALRAAAEQAETLAELLQAELGDPRGLRTLSRSQLAQWIRLARGGGLELQPFESEAGAVRVVATPGAIRHHYDWLIWMGGGDDPLPAFEWSASDVEALREAGIELDPRENVLQAHLARQRDGLALARQRLVVVQMPARDDARISPLWTHIDACLSGGERRRRPVGLDALVAGRAAHPALPILRRRARTEPPQPARANWRITFAGPLPQFARSASEMTDHLACPLRWVLRRVARIAPAGNVRLPEERRLAGTFCHQVLRRAFNEGALPGSPADWRRRVLEVFDQRVALDAAALASAAAAPARGRLRDQLGGATQRLVELLQEGGYRQVAFEVPFEVPLERLRADDEGDSLAMRGVIDCLGTRADGREVVVDFKLGGDGRLRDAVRTGRAVQLAAYAHSRFRITGRYPAVAYLVLSTAQIYAPRDSRPRGLPADACESGPSIMAVWKAFREATEAASSWTDGGQVVPCRPLQPVHEWPRGAELVLDSKGRGEDWVQPCCRYCDYGALCGHTSLE